MGKFTRTLEKIYFNPKNSGSFCGVEKLYKAALKLRPSITRKDVKDWLSSQQTYSLFKPVRRRFLRLPILVDHIDGQWQADLMDVSWWKQPRWSIIFVGSY